MRRFLHKKNAGMTGNVNLTKCLNENNKKCHSEAFFAEESTTTKHHLNNKLVVTGDNIMKKGYLINKEG